MAELTEFDNNRPAGNGAGPKTIDLGIEGLSAAVHLGSGGSANVFAARVMDTGEQVAVKLLRASADSEKERTRFEREQETLRTLASQDGIVPVLDAGLTDREEPYFLMPLMEGSLQDRIDTDGALDWQTATQLIAEVADTVEFAHTQKILHRDLKPGNILLDEEGVPRVADFGIAKLLDSSLSKSSKSLGTPSFMPPERFNGEEATTASDVYGLAATLSALITGSAPFLTGENDTDVAVMMRVVTEEPPSLDGHDVPEAVRGAVHAAMAKSPDERPQTAGEFASILRLAIDPHMDPALAGPVTIAIPRRHLTIPDGPATTGSSQRAATIELGDDDKSNKKRAWLVPAAAALFIALLGTGAALALGGDEDGPGEVETADGAPQTDDQATVEVQDTGEADIETGLVDGQDETDGSNGSDDDASADGDADNGDGDETVDAEKAGVDTADEGNGTDDGGTSLGEGEAGGGAGEEGEPDGDGPVTTDPPASANACFSSSSSSVETGQTVSFSNCSTDATSYSWDFGDGTTSSNRNATKSWTTTGSKTVTLTARGDGGTDTMTIRVMVTAEPPPPVEPTACMQPNTTSVETGHHVAFANCSSDATSYSWDFGDGTSSAQTSPSKTWTTTGSKTVRLTATGPGGSDWVSTTITVTAQVNEPVACFTASTTSPEVGSSVSFSNCSTDATSYSWDFGDGGHSTHTSTSHTYTSVGSYTVRLTATGPGGTDDAWRTITVESKNEPDPQLVPKQITCTTLGESEWSWTWETLPAWVDDYLIEFSGGSTTSVGRQPPAYHTTNVVTRIIAVKDGVWSPANVPSCEPYSADGPDVPSGVSCRFSNFRMLDGLWTWTETWSWNDDPSVAEYRILLDSHGSNSEVGSSRGTYTTDPSNGQPSSGFSAKQIIAIDAAGNRAVRGLNPCGNHGGGGWESPPN